MTPPAGCAPHGAWPGAWQGAWQRAMALLVVLAAAAGLTVAPALWRWLTQD